MTEAVTPERARVRKRRVAVLLTLLLVLLALASWAVIALLQLLIGSSADYTGAGSGSVVIEVESGDSAAAIGSTLFDAGVVASEGAFVSAAKDDDRALGIQPGFYELREGMSGRLALDLLLDPASRVQTTIAVPEGLRLDQTLDRLAEQSGIARDEFEAVVAEPRGLGLPRYAHGSAEGYLFPATYTFDPDVTAEQIVRAMIERFDVAADELDLVDRAGEVGRTPAEVVTIGSLVQAEVAERDFGMASRVIVNRLTSGTPLQFDSTVNYALDSADLTLDSDQLDVDSPYNTYQNTGLPPGPINSPGEAALAAALEPTPGDWVYFVALKPGSDVTRFTASYDEFLQFKDEFYAEVG